MRDASTYRGARRNICRPLWGYMEGERTLLRARSPFAPNQTPIKQRSYVYTGRMYPAGWLSIAERKARAFFFAGVVPSEQPD